MISKRHTATRFILSVAVWPFLDMYSKKKKEGFYEYVNSEDQAGLFGVCC